MLPDEMFDYWKSYAERDLDTAAAMHEAGKWFYVVFMCQQSIEKSLKGLYMLYVDTNVPKIHNIKALVERFEDKLSEPVTEERYTLFKLLTSHYIDGRYPDYVNQINNITETEATKILTNSKEAFKWLLTQKPQKE